LLALGDQDSFYSGTSWVFAPNAPE
jgi:hypothetical protein